MTSGSWPCPHYTLRVAEALLVQDRHGNVVSHRSGVYVGMLPDVSRYSAAIEPLM